MRRASGARDTAELRLRPARRGRRSLVVIILAMIGLCGLAVAAVGSRGPAEPKNLTPARPKRVAALGGGQAVRANPQAASLPTLARANHARPRRGERQR